MFEQVFFMVDIWTWECKERRLEIPLVVLGVLLTFTQKSNMIIAFNAYYFMMVN